jgi:long-subunit fatty acid transport protein
MFNKEVSMKKLLLVAALSVATTSVFAQAKNFEGFFVEGGLAIGSSSFKNSEVDNTSGSTFTSNDEYGSKSFTKGRVSLGYMKAVDNNFLVGVSVSSLLGSTTLFNGTNSDGETDTAKLKNSYQIALVPAYAVSDKFAVRGKVSYNKAKFESNALYDDGGTLVPTSSSAKFNGIGLGVGAQYFFTKNLYGAIDIERITMSSKSLNIVNDGQPVASSDYAITSKPTQTMGLISIGYKF